MTDPIPEPISEPASPPPRRRSGSSRSLLLDELTQQKVCAVVALGCSQPTAAAYVGCRLDAIRRTARRNRQFAVLLNKAEVACEVGSLTQLNKATKDERNWRVALWLLERRYPDRFGRRKPRTASPRQVADVVDQFVEIILAEVTDAEDRSRIVERMQSVHRRLRRPDEAEEAR